MDEWRGRSQLIALRPRICRCSICESSVIRGGHQPDINTDIRTKHVLSSLSDVPFPSVCTYTRVFFLSIKKPMVKIAEYFFCYTYFLVHVFYCSNSIRLWSASFFAPVYILPRCIQINKNSKVYMFYLQAKFGNIWSVFSMLKLHFGHLLLVSRLRSIHLRLQNENEIDHLMNSYIHETCQCKFIPFCNHLLILRKCWASLI